jgi:hypothetical protein
LIIHFFPSLIRFRRLRAVLNIAATPRIPRGAGMLTGTIGFIGSSVDVEGAIDADFSGCASR